MIKIEKIINSWKTKESLILSASYSLQWCALPLMIEAIKGNIEKYLENHFCIQWGVQVYHPDKH